MTSDIFEVDVINGTLPGSGINLLTANMVPPASYGTLEFQFRSSVSGILSVQPIRPIPKAPLWVIKAIFPG